MRPDDKPRELQILAYCCRYCTYAAADLAGTTMRLGVSPLQERAEKRSVGATGSSPRLRKTETIHVTNWDDL